MEKKNDKRARDLADAVRKGKEEGKSLTEKFAEYGEKNGLARGSVRNAYYELVKKSRSDAFAEKYLGGERLTAQEIRSFGTEEERTLVKTVLLGKRDGRSARSVIFELSGGDPKLALRFQNKYRNVLRSKPQLIRELVEEIRAESGIPFDALTDVSPRFRESQLKKLQSEINALVERISDGVRAENERLKERVRALESENAELTAALGEDGSRAAEFFGKKSGKNILN